MTIKFILLDLSVAEITRKHIRINDVLLHAELVGYFTIIDDKCILITRCGNTTFILDGLTSANRALTGMPITTGRYLYDSTDFSVAIRGTEIKCALGNQVLQKIFKGDNPNIATWTIEDGTNWIDTIESDDSSGSCIGF